jgi:alpha-1,6-mannosyltransferase
VGVHAGAVPELVNDSVGEFAAPEDAPSLARAIRRLYDRDLDQLGAAARARVLQGFTWSHSLSVALANYASVLSGARTRPAMGPAMEFDPSRP